jgi:hypothetical protein
MTEIKFSNNDFDFYWNASGQQVETFPNSYRRALNWILMNARHPSGIW